ncbi:uncharacterized protein LOC142335018 [Convolutriloba macropyga]|uniref:uncharacterized protein LOC142335018 n=1 Tax=Convolutriloba macropyga TaxID=536237 RepID=UPI003F5278A9
MSASNMLNRANTLVNVGYGKNLPSRLMVKHGQSPIWEPVTLMTSVELRELMAVNLEKMASEMGLNSVDAVDSVAGSLKVITLYKEELSQQTMSSVHSVSIIVAASLIQFAPELDQGSLETMTESATSAIASVLMAIKLTSIEEKKDSEEKNNTSATADQMPTMFQEAKSGLPPAPVAKLTEMTFEMISTTDTVLRACQINKQGGEPDTVLKTENIGIVLMKGSKETITGENGIEKRVSAIGMVLAPTVVLPRYDYLKDEARNWPSNRLISMNFGVSLMSSLLVLPIAVLIVQLFRRTKPYFNTEEDLLDDLDAEEEMYNAEERALRKEEKRAKREERKKEQLAKYLKAAGLTVEKTTNKQPVLSESTTETSQSISTQGLIQNKDEAGMGSRHSSNSSRSGESSVNSSSKHSEHNSGGGSSGGDTGSSSGSRNSKGSSDQKRRKSNDQVSPNQVLDNDKREIEEESGGQLMVTGGFDVLQPEDLGEVSVSESSSSSSSDSDKDLVGDEERIDGTGGGGGGDRARLVKSKKGCCGQKKRRFKWLGFIQCCFGLGTERRRRRKRHLVMLPSSFLYINWLLVVMVMVSSTILITLYASMIAHNGGSETVNKWVVSMVVSVLMSIFLVQPLKLRRCFQIP